MSQKDLSLPLFHFCWLTVVCLVEIRILHPRLRINCSTDVSLGFYSPSSILPPILLLFPFFSHIIIVIHLHIWSPHAAPSHHPTNPFFFFSFASGTRFSFSFTFLLTTSLSPFWLFLSSVELFLFFSSDAGLFESPSTHPYIIKIHKHSTSVHLLKRVAKVLLHHWSSHHHLLVIISHQDEWKMRWRAKKDRRGGGKGWWEEMMFDALSFLSMNFRYSSLQLLLRSSCHVFSLSDSVLREIRMTWLSHSFSHTLLGIKTKNSDWYNSSQFTVILTSTFPSLSSHPPHTILNMSGKRLSVYL